MEKLKVVLSGLIFPLTMMHYFWRALERRDDVELFVTGPFFDTYIPWNYGMHLPKKHVKVPNLPLGKEFAGRSVSPKMIEPFLPWKPDLWIQVDANWHFAERPNAEVVALVQTDPHVLQSWYQEPKKYSDFSFCMQQPYMSPGDWYLPYAYDPTIHFPMEIEKEYDACLIGLHYTDRDALVAQLRNKGLNVYYDIGPIYDDYRILVNKAKIGLNWSNKQDMNARVWELAAMRVCAVENRVPDMDNFLVANEHYLCFENLQGAVANVMLALNDNELREGIADAAYRKITSGKNTWDDRVQFMLETMKLR